MINRHERIQKEIYEWFDFYNHPEYDDVASEFEHDAYDFAYNNIDYETIFTKHGLPTDTEVYSDEYGVTVDVMHRYYIEENYGCDILDNVNSDLTDAYFDKYYDKLHELVENTISGDEENDSVR